MDDIAKNILTARTWIIFTQLYHAKLNETSSVNFKTTLGDATNIKGH